MLLAHEYIFLPHSDFHPFSPFCQSHSNVQVTDFIFIRMTPKAFQRIPSKGICMKSFVDNLSCTGIVIEGTLSFGPS